MTVAEEAIERAQGELAKAGRIIDAMLGTSGAVIPIQPGEMVPVDGEPWLQEYLGSCLGGNVIPEGR